MLNEWKNIENDGKSEKFAAICSLTHLSDGTMNGNFQFPNGVDLIDSNWHEMVLKYRNNNEHFTCRDLAKLIECVEIPEKFWLSDKVNFISESTFWARLGRKYKTRYINKGLYIVHYDGGESLIRVIDKEKAHYNNLVSRKFFLEENLDYFFWNPKYFYNQILKMIVSGIELGISPFKILKEIKSIKLKLAYIFSWPIGAAAWFHLKFIKRRFWFHSVPPKTK